jgi:hypothetical protein
MNSRSVSKKGGCVFTLALLALLQKRAKEKAVIRFITSEYGSYIYTSITFSDIIQELQK